MFVPSVLSLCPKLESACAATGFSKKPRVAVPVFPAVDTGRFDRLRLCAFECVYIIQSFSLFLTIKKCFSEKGVFKCVRGVSCDVTRASFNFQMRRDPSLHQFCTRDEEKTCFSFSTGLSAKKKGSPKRPLQIWKLVQENSALALISPSSSLRHVRSSLHGTCGCSKYMPGKILAVFRVSSPGLFQKNSRIPNTGFVLVGFARANLYSAPAVSLAIILGF